jgi:MOSC domain-containing protein
VVAVSSGRTVDGWRASSARATGMAEMVGTVATLSRFPVKSMQGARLARVEVAHDGLVGDRAYALVERDTGKVMSAKDPHVGARLLACRSEFVEDPELGDDPPPVRITMPDGASVTSDAPTADAALSAFLGCHVTLQRAAAAGMSSPVAAGPFVDAFPVSVLTTSTLGQLQALRPDSRFDERRFRMNVVVGTSDDGFVENEWIGRSLHIGEAVRLTIVLSDPRCVMTTLAQDDLPKDTEIMRTLARHNRLEVAGQPSPCAGVYAVVDTAGPACAGDRVSLA